MPKTKAVQYGEPIYGWGYGPQTSTPPAPQLTERVPAEIKPVLYDHSGRPLVRAIRDKRMGFRPPTEGR